MSTDKAMVTDARAAALKVFEEEFNGTYSGAELVNRMIDAYDAALAQAEQPVAVIEFARGTQGRENEMPRVLSCNWLPDGAYSVYLSPPAKREAGETAASGTPPPQSHLMGTDLLRSEVEKLCTRDNGEHGELVSRASVLALIDLMQGVPHPDDLAVDRFAAAMKAKLAKKRADGRGGWEDPAECSIAFLSELLRDHVNKGDPVDVGNLSMMIHQRGGVIE